MADRSVRPARLTDVDEVVAVQRRAWSALPPRTWAVPDVADLDVQAMGRAWERALLLPPSSRHRLLLALDGAQLVGLSALVPAEDPDRANHSAADQTDELVLLVVDPAHRSRGHGSRLLAASVDLARAAGTTSLLAWLPAADDSARGFLTGTGWAPDGAHRTVEVTEGPSGVERAVRELRFATSLTAAPVSNRTTGT